MEHDKKTAAFTGLGPVTSCFANGGETGSSSTVNSPFFSISFSRPYAKRKSRRRQYDGVGAVVFAFCFFSFLPAHAQGFGQNHVIIEDFQWKVRSTEHFDIYYYEASAPIVGQAAEILERAFSHVNKVLDIAVVTSTGASPSKDGRLPLWERRPFFLYASANDFTQSNIVRVGEGTGGVTEPFKDRFMVYNDGTRQWLDEVITHEFTHVMQYYVLVSGFWKSARVLKSIIYPLWMMEGMAGYASKHIESSLEEMTIRDAATSGRILPLVKLEHFGHLKPHQVTLAYKEGAAAMDFLDSQYGPKKVADMLRLFETKFEVSAVLRDLLGLDIVEFDKKFQEYLKTKYERVVRKNGLREPESYGAALTKPADGLPQFNASAALTPDGNKMFFMSTRQGQQAQVFEMDIRSGRTRKIVNVGDMAAENISMGNFANISRVLAVSADGGTLVFAATKNHRSKLYFYDIRLGRLEIREVEGLTNIAQPQFSPDGAKVVFSGMRESTTDIYLYDLKTRKTDRLTDDPQDDEMPVFLPKGDAVIYSAEVRDPRDSRKNGRRLYRLNLADRSLERLEDLPGDSRDPIVSADGRRVLFVLNDGQFSEICELNISARKVARLTRAVGGMFTPSYAGENGIVFSSLRRGEVHIYKGVRDDFLSEEIAPAKPELDNVDKFLLPGMGSVQGSTSTVTLTAERPYRFSAGTDLFLPALFFSSPGGLFSTAYWQGSDLLGNHTAGALLSYGSSQGYFDYQTSYAYNRYRPQLFAGAAGRGQRDLYDGDRGLSYSEGLHAQFAGVSYPLDRFHRIEASVASITDIISYRGAPRLSGQTRALSYALVRDTSTGRYLVATRGSRVRLAYDQALLALGGNLRYDTASLEAQKFIETGSQSTLALRAAGVQSVGKDHQAFLLGGLGGVRGYSRSYEFVGSRQGVLNAEWRFPLFKNLDYHMWYFFPDFYFKAVFGSLFADAGYAWNSSGEISRARWRELRQSVGFGVKIFTFILQEFPLTISMDYARRTTQTNAGIFYVYLGSAF